MPADADTDRPLIAVAVLASFVAFLDGSVVNLALPAIGRRIRRRAGAAAVGRRRLSADPRCADPGRRGHLRSVRQAVVLRMGLVVFAVSSLLCAVAPTGWVLVGRAMPAGGRRGVPGAQLAGDDQRPVLGCRAGPRHRYVDGVDGHGVRDRPAARRRARRRAGLAVDLRGQHRAAGGHAVSDDQAVARRVRSRTGRRASTTSAPRSTPSASPARSTRSSRGSGSASRIRRCSSAFGVGVACLIAFPWWERRTPHPMMPLNIFAARNFAVGNLATVFLYAAVSLGMLIVALFLQETAGLSATAGRAGHAAGAGAVVLPGPPVRHAGRRARAAAVHGGRPADRRDRLPVDVDGERAVQLLDADAARAGGVRPRADDHGVAADGGDPGRGRSGAERHRFGGQQRGLADRRD